MVISNAAKEAARVRRAVYAKTDGRCYYCGIGVLIEGEIPKRDWLLLKGSPTSLRLVPEHADPISRGGRDRLDNLLPSCAYCNAAKGSLTLNEFRFVKGLRDRNLSFGFACESPQPQRDWLCVYSEERHLFAHNMPWATAAYSRGKANRNRSASFKRKARPQ